MSISRHHHPLRQPWVLSAAVLGPHSFCVFASLYWSICLGSVHCVSVKMCIVYTSCTITLLRIHNVYRTQCGFLLVLYILQTKYRLSLASLARTYVASLYNCVLSSMGILLLNGIVSRYFQLLIFLCKQLQPWCRCFANLTFFREFSKLH